MNFVKLEFTDGIDYTNDLKQWCDRSIGKVGWELTHKMIYTDPHTFITVRVLFFAFTKDVDATMFRLAWVK